MQGTTQVLVMSIVRTSTSELQPVWSRQTCGVGPEMAPGEAAIICGEPLAWICILCVVPLPEVCIFNTPTVLLTLALFVEPLDAWFTFSSSSVKAGSRSSLPWNLQQFITICRSACVQEIYKTKQFFSSIIKLFIHCLNSIYIIDGSVGNFQ